MKIYVTGEGMSLEKKEFKNVKMGRVVGIMDIGSNNGDNNFGWSGIKAVVNSDGELYLLDFAEEAAVYTNDDIFVHFYPNNNMWLPDITDLKKYDLFLYENGMY